MSVHVLEEEEGANEQKQKQEQQQATQQQQQQENEFIKNIISKEKPYLLFVNSLRTEQTRRTYSSILIRFIKNHHQLTSTFDLLPPRLTIEKIQEMLMNHLIEMQKSDLSSSHVRTSLGVLKHFYKMNDITGINFDKIARFQGEFRRKNKLTGYTIEQIQRILSKCDPRLRVVILVLASTGMRIGALVELRLSHIEKKQTRVGDVYEFTVYENASEESICFCSPECAAEIDSYLEDRKRSGEQLLPEHPFIREQFDHTDLEQVRKRAKPVSKNTLANMMQAILVRSEIKEINHQFTKRERTTTPVFHGFRYWWMNQAVKAKMQPEIREMLLSHKIGLASSYYRPSEDELLEEYVKAIEKGYFTISEEQKLKQKVQILEGEKSQYDTLASNQDDLSKQVGQLQNFLKNLFDLDLSLSKSQKGKLGEITEIFLKND